MSGEDYEQTTNYRHYLEYKLHMLLRTSHLSVKQLESIIKILESK